MKSLLCVLAILLSFALVPTRALADLPAPKSTPESANIAAGRKAIEAKDYKAAVGYLAKAVQEEPNNADAQNMLG
jgi:Flp pilus assembly protein TadD